MHQINVIQQLSAKAMSHFEQNNSAAATAALRELLASSRHFSAVTAASLFEGRVQGEEIFLVDADALEFGMHPFREVYDLGIVDDNGDVCLELSSRKTFRAADELVVVSHATLGTRQRSLSRKFAPPRIISLCDQMRLEGDGWRHRDRGVVNIVWAPDLPQQWLIVWRRDLRSRIDVHVISAHSSKEYAIARVKNALEAFDAPKDHHRRYASMPDYQRSQVYLWEAQVANSTGYSRLGFDAIDQCQAYLADVYLDLDLESCPTIRAGRPDLESSYYKPFTDRITLSEYGMERWTVLHEAAHHLTEKIRREPAHGPAFVGVLTGLLVAYAGVDQDIALEMAAELNVDLDPGVLQFMLDRHAGATIQPTAAAY